MGQESAMANILIVDDEVAFLQSSAEGLTLLESDIRVMTAANGREAVEVLSSVAVDLVITDLKMPEMDGFELLAYLSRFHPDVPVIAMTAFGSPEIRTRLGELGTHAYLEKPIAYDTLAAAIRRALAAHAERKPYVFSLVSFLQLLAIERMSCRIRVESRGRVGDLFVANGELVAAETGATDGREAACMILSWRDPRIEMTNPSRKVRNVHAPLEEILLEALDQPDHCDAGVSVRSLANQQERQLGPQELLEMSANARLEELVSIDGFRGAGLFSAEGEPIAMVAAGGMNLKAIGASANNVLVYAQRSSRDMGGGQAHLVHIETESGVHILARCWDSAMVPDVVRLGSFHAHLVLALGSDAQIGLAKIKLLAVLGRLAEDLAT